ncbi:single-stranded DNA-binding protein [Monashia sp. NPDC004114]
MAARTSRSAPRPPEQEAVRNEVVLWGRLAAEAQERELPSGDVIVTLRVVVPRRGGPSRPRAATAGAPRRATVDTIDVVCWTAATRRAALRLGAGEAIEIGGALRRRFFGAAVGRQSRYEVEAGVVRRLSGSGSGAS